MRESHRSTNANGRKTFLSFLSVFYLYKVKQRALCLKEKQEVKVQDREQGGKEMARELG